jgi:hypothetical protein
VTSGHQWLLASSPEESTHVSFSSDIEALEQESWKNLPLAVPIAACTRDEEEDGDNDDRDDKTSVCQIDSVMNMTIGIIHLSSVPIDQL